VAKIRKIGDTKPNVVIFQGSSRDEDSCPGQISKTRKVVNYVLDKWSFAVDFELVDLSVNFKKGSVVQPCKGCVSTSSYHCHWACDCYSKKNPKKPDLLHDEDVYTKLENSDGFLVFTPIHWHAPSSQVKALFDRLVCSNMTLSREDAKKVLGEKNIKNAEVTGKLSLEGKSDHLLKNHLSGKFAGFYIHGDAGANDYGRGKLPDTFSKSEENSWYSDPKATIMPQVLQCKYSGIEVPDNLIEAFYTNKGLPYYEANLDFWENETFFKRADKLIENFLQHLENR
jgi:multimeric flavodoxin WrbA